MMTSIDINITGITPVTRLTSPRASDAETGTKTNGRVADTTAPITSPESSVGETSDKSVSSSLRAQVEDVVRRANEYAQSKNLSVNYSIDEATEKVVVKVINKDTEEVVRQIPPDEFLELSARLSNFQSMIFDKEG